MSIGSLLKSAGQTTALHGLFGANDEVFGVAKNMWYKNPNKAMVWGVVTAGMALATTYDKRIAILAAFLDPFVTRACTAHKKKIASEVPPQLKRDRIIGAMIAGISTIATGKIILDTLKESMPKQKKRKQGQIYNHQHKTSM